MDREQREHYQVVIEAKDMAGQKGGLIGSTTVNISLTDINDNAPHFKQGEHAFSRYKHKNVNIPKLMFAQDFGSIIPIVPIKLSYIMNNTNTKTSNNNERYTFLLLCEAKMVCGKAYCVRSVC